MLVNTNREKIEIMESKPVGISHRPNREDDHWI